MTRTERTPLQLLDPLNVILEFDTQYEVYVARCLQTGHLVTADDAQMAKEMITELLEDVVSDAIEHNDPARLLSNPAPLEVWAKYRLAAQTGRVDERKIKIHGTVPHELRLLLGQAEVEAEISIATGRTSNAA